MLGGVTLGKFNDEDLLRAEACSTSGRDVRRPVGVEDGDLVSLIVGFRDYKKSRDVCGIIITTCVGIQLERSTLQPSMPDLIMLDTPLACVIYIV